MTSSYKVTPSNVVPLTNRLVVTTARPIVTTSNPQTSNPPFPVTLSDTVPVQAGGSNSFRSEAFTNNTGRPIELRSLTTLIRLPYVPSSATGIAAGGLVGLDIEIDGVKVTRDATPVWAFCRSDNRLDEGFARGVTGGTTGAYTWYFSQPVPLLPGRGIKVSVTHFGVLTDAATVTVSFAGRVSPAPIPRRIPYVVSWTSRSFGSAEVGTDSIPPNTLSNDTKRDLTVDRIIGRAIANEKIGAGALNFTDFADRALQASTTFTLRLGLAASRPILKSFAQWRAVFGNNASLETDFVMRPGDYFTADVRHAASPALLAGAFTASQNRALLSIVGWREV